MSDTVFWVLVALVWLPGICFLASDLSRLIKRKRAERRMAACLREQAEAYAAVEAFRPLDLTEPKGRSRLGLPVSEEDQ